MCGKWLDNSFQVQAKGFPPSAQTDMSFGFSIVPVSQRAPENSIAAAISIFWCKVLANFVLQQNLSELIHQKIQQ